MTAGYQVTAFFCENILMDTNGRQSLIGIMSTVLHVADFPVVLPVGVFARITPLPPASTPIHIELRIGEKTVASFDGLSVPPDEGDAIMPALHMAAERAIINLIEPSVVQLFVRVGDNPNVLAAVLQVARPPAATSQPEEHQEA